MVVESEAAGIHRRSLMVSRTFSVSLFFFISFIFLLRYDTNIVDYLSVLSTALSLGGVMVIGRSDR